jgi:hypothetical protein
MCIDSLKSKAGAGLVVFGLAASACAPDAIGPTRHRQPLSSASAILLQPAREPRGVEDDILRIEAKVPGFGGFYADSVGGLVAYVRDVTNSSAATAALKDLALSDPGRFYVTGASPKITIRQADFAFSQLVGWEESLLESVRPRGVLLYDADER